MANRKNMEGYPDPTAFEAEKHLEKEEKEKKHQAEEEVDMVARWLIGALRLEARKAGFDITNSVKLKHRKTGIEIK